MIWLALLGIVGGVFSLIPKIKRKDKLGITTSSFLLIGLVVLLVSYLFE